MVYQILHNINHAASSSVQENTVKSRAAYVTSSSKPHTQVGSIALNMEMGLPLYLKSNLDRMYVLAC